MFRKLARKNKQISDEECISILINEKRGVLSVIGDDGYPYGMPLNHFYNEQDGHIYFHSGKTGHKIDALKNNDKVSFCVYDEGCRREGEWALDIRSVIVFGRIRFVEDQEKALEISRRLSYKFTDDKDYIENEISCFGQAVLVLELIPEHMCGKLVKEA